MKFSCIFYVVLTCLLAVSHAHAITPESKKEREALKKIVLLVNESQYKDALELWQKSASKQRLSVSFLYWGGTLYLYQPSKLKSKNRIYIRKGISLLQQAEKILQHYYKSSSREQKRYFNVLIYLSLAYNMLSNQKMASSYLKKALYIDDSNKLAWYNIGITQENRKQYIEALKSYLRYKKIEMAGDDDF